MENHLRFNQNELFVIITNCSNNPFEDIVFTSEDDVENSKRMHDNEHVNCCTILNVGELYSKGYSDGGSSVGYDYR